MAEERRRVQVGRDGELVARRHDVAGEPEVGSSVFESHGHRRLVVRGLWPYQVTRSRYGRDSCRSPDRPRRSGCPDRRARRSSDRRRLHRPRHRRPARPRGRSRRSRRAGVEPGAMTLVDGEQIARIVRARERLGPSRRGLGGQHCGGLASLGDQPDIHGLGRARTRSAPSYELDLGSLGCRCVLEPRRRRSRARASASCWSRPTRGRTMATNLGRGRRHRPRGGRAGCRDRLGRRVYIEGYLLDSPGTFAAIERAVEAREGAAVGLVALSLSDPFLVERHGEVLPSSSSARWTCCSPTRRRRGASPGPTTCRERSRPWSGPGSMAAVTLGAEGAVLLTAASAQSSQARPVGPRGRHDRGGRPVRCRRPPRHRPWSAAGGRRAGSEPSPPPRSSPTSARSPWSRLHSLAVQAGLAEPG